MLFNQKESATVDTSGAVTLHEVLVECVCCKQFVAPTQIVPVPAANPSSDVVDTVPFCGICFDL